MTALHLRRAFVENRDKIVVFTARRNDAIGMQRAIDCGTAVPYRWLLHQSALCGSDNTARLLLTLGTWSAAETDDSFLVAVMHRHINVTRVMLGHGVSAHTLSKALYSAVLKNCMDIMELLLAYGADVTTIRNPKRCLLAAIRNGNIPMMKVFLDAGMLLDMTPSLLNGDPIHVVAQVGTVEMMGLLLEHGASVNAKGFDCCTPLHKTVICAGRDEMIRFLLDNAADMNVMNYSSYSPLALAVSKGNVEAVRILLEYGADVASVKMHHWKPGAYGKLSLRCSEDVRKVLVEFGVILDS